VEQLLQSNNDISKRLWTLENKSEAQSVSTTFKNGSRVDVVGGGRDDSEVARVQSTSLKAYNISRDLPSPGFHHPFEFDLNTSRVYKRTLPYECDVSFRSSAVRSHAWSVFSGLSLSQISAISAIALPIYSFDIFNREWYEFEVFGDGDSQSIRTIQETSFSSTPGVDFSKESGDNLSLSLEPISSLFSHIEKGPVYNVRTGYGARVAKVSATENADKLTLYKLVVLGDEDVGKTELTFQVRTSSTWTCLSF